MQNFKVIAPVGASGQMGEVLLSRAFQSFFVTHIFELARVAGYVPRWHTCKLAVILVLTGSDEE